MKWDTLAPKEIIEKTAEALRARGVSVDFAETRQEALEKIKKIIPSGAEVMAGGSKTLEQIGFVDVLKSGNHPWKNLKDEILKEEDPKKQAELRRKSVASEYFLGSVHAVCQTGEIVVASATGSQLPAYSFTSNNVIWVVGGQKIVSDLEEGLRRVREYSFILEDARMKSLGFSGSVIAKILIFSREINPNRKITLIFVNEVLGF
ncbi:MAG: lactate utilization protein [bacterium]|nr:lactate utilization protein [bacterium]